MAVTVAAAPAAASGTALAGIDPPFNGLDETAADVSVSDTIVAANGSKVLQAVNRNVRMTNSLGGAAQSMSLEQFFGAAPAQGPMFDPKVYFDRNAVNQRFYVIALQEDNVDDNDPADDFSVIHLAISRSSDPSDLSPANWCRYPIDALHTSPATNNQKTHADFPGLGVGTDAIVISANQHTPAEFAVAVVRVLSKQVFSDNANSCPTESFWKFEGSNVFNDFSAHTLQPAQHYTSPTSLPGRTNPVYLVSSRHQMISSTYRLWRIANVTPFNPATPPVIENMSISWATYSPPPDAPGGAGGAKIDTGDARILQVAGVGDAITAVHTIACPNTPNSPLESCLRTVRFTIDPANGAVTKSELQGLGGGDNAFYHHPAVAVNNSHQTTVVFLANTPLNSHRVSSRVATKAVNAGFGQSMTLTDGTCARAPIAPGLPVGTGDYTGAQTAIDGNAFWVAAEHAELIGGVCKWQTRIARVTP
ncbi:MAG TPA: hypothetical protein VFU43_09335 [Streptosporangiaceae bacterium]|nr:hypothetical protein [Streptosporangiaceae bacterium]